MARKVGSRRRNMRGTAPGLPGKHRPTGFISHAELMRRKRMQGRLVVFVIALTSCLMLMAAAVPLW